MDLRELDEFLGVWFFEDGPKTLVMDRWEPRKFYDEDKKEDYWRWVVWFRGVAKPMKMNKVNPRAISKLYGTRDTNKLLGKSVTFYKTQVDYRGELVDGVRVRPEIPAESERPTMREETVEELEARLKRAREKAEPPKLQPPSVNASIPNAEYEEAPHVAG